MNSLLDKYLPRYTFHEHHKIIVNATQKDVFNAAKNLDLNGSFITKRLLRIRGLPVTDLSLQGFIKNVCFKYIEEDQYNEFVIDAAQPNLEIFWNFYFKEEAENKILVSTETRILCLTKRSRFLFSVYWLFVKPFSGITRREMLRLIKENAEQSN